MLYNELGMSDSHPGILQKACTRCQVITSYFFISPSLHFSDSLHIFRLDLFLSEMFNSTFSFLSFLSFFFCKKKCNLIERLNWKDWQRLCARAGGRVLAKERRNWKVAAVAAAAVKTLSLQAPIEPVSESLKMNSSTSRKIIEENEWEKSKEKWRDVFVCWTDRLEWGLRSRKKKAFFWNEIFPTMTEYEHSFFYFSIFLFSFIIWRIYTCNVVEEPDGRPRIFF